MPLIEPAKEPSKNSFLLILLLGVALAINLLYFNRGWVSMDEGYFLAPLLNIQHGQLAHLNFEINHPGLIYYWQWLCITCFGKSILATRLGLLVLSVLMSGLCFWLSSHWLKPKWAFTIGLFSILLGPVGFYNSNPTWLSCFITFLILGILWKSFQKGRTGLFITGILLGLTLLLKQSIGIFLLSGILWGLMLSTRLLPQVAQEKANPTHHLSLVLLLLILHIKVLSTSPEGFWLHTLIYLGPLLLLLVPLISSLWITETPQDAAPTVHLALSPRNILHLALGSIIGLLIGFLLPLALLPGKIDLALLTPLLYKLYEDLFINVPQQVSGSFQSHLPTMILPWAWDVAGYFWLSFIILLIPTAWLRPAWLQRIPVFRVLPNKISQALLATVCLFIWASMQDWQHYERPQGYFDLLWGGLTLLRPACIWSGSLLLCWLTGTQTGRAWTQAQWESPEKQAKLGWALFLFTSMLSFYWITFPVATLNYQLYGSSLCLLWLAVCFSYSQMTTQWNVLQKKLAQVSFIALFIAGCLFIPGKWTLWRVEPFSLFKTSLQKTHADILITPAEAKLYQETVAQIQQYAPHANDPILVLPDNPELFWISQRVNPLPHFLIYPKQYPFALPGIQKRLQQPVNLVILADPRPDTCNGFFKAMDYPPQLLGHLLSLIQKRYHLVYQNVCFYFFIPDRTASNRTSNP